MSIKRRLEYNYNRLRDAVSAFSLPEWMDSAFVRVGLAAIFILFGAFYVFKVSDMATIGYQIRDLEKQVADLETETRSLQVEIAEKSSLASVEKRLAGAQMVAIKDMKYFSAAEAVVAKR